MGNSITNQCATLAAGFVNMPVAQEQWTATMRVVEKYQQERGTVAIPVEVTCG